MQSNESDFTVGIVEHELSIEPSTWKGALQRKKKNIKEVSIQFSDYHFLTLKYAWKQHLAQPSKILQISKKIL